MSFSSEFSGGRVSSKDTNLQQHYMAPWFPERLKIKIHAKKSSFAVVKEEK